MSTINEIIYQNPALKSSKIRIDKETKQVSVIDVIRLITGKNSSAAGQTLTRLTSDMTTRYKYIRINGKGKLTPVTDDETMVRIISLLPGNYARKIQALGFRDHIKYKTALKELIMSGETKMSDENNNSTIEMKLATFEVSPQDLDQTQVIDTFLPSLTTRIEAVVEDLSGIVYFIRAKGTDNVKIGYTQGPVLERLNQLQVGSFIELEVLASFVSSNCRDFERRMHIKYQDNHVRGEWFDISGDALKHLLNSD
jgi:hypothetical protein